MTRAQRMLTHLAIRALIGRGGSYQPVILDGRMIVPDLRNTEERISAVLPVLAAAEVRTVVDHGSAQGYFVRRCAEEGYLALGVEPSLRSLAIAHLSLAHDDLGGYGFVRMHLDPDNVDLLPEMDATLSLSVMHHLMAALGVERTRDMLRSIRARTRKVLVFEMGQSDETAFEWAERLPDMGRDPHGWIAEFLASAGYLDLDVICRTPSFRSQIERATFAAYTQPHLAQS